MDIEPAKPVVNGRMWQPGQSGNLNGRPCLAQTSARSLKIGCRRRRFGSRLHLHFIIGLER